MKEGYSMNSFTCDFCHKQHATDSARMHQYRVTVTWGAGDIYHDPRLILCPNCAEITFEKSRYTHDTSGTYFELHPDDWRKLLARRRKINKEPTR
jgi:hypothetical protein